jgi:Mn-dependent DtxR family transcriptional regulator
VSIEELLEMRSWPRSRLERLLRRAVREGLVRRGSASRFRLTDAGARHALRAVRNHRMWELYLINYADIAPSHVDRDADAIEHVLEPELIEELELLLSEQFPVVAVPESPHPIGQPAAAAGSTT